MPVIHVTEADYRALAAAATQAQRTGDRERAEQLDRLARMANASLTASSLGVRLAREVCGARSRISWRDMPSAIEEV